MNLWIDKKRSGTFNKPFDQYQGCDQGFANNPNA